MLFAKQLQRQWAHLRHSPQPLSTAKVTHNIWLDEWWELSEEQCLMGDIPDTMRALVYRDANDLRLETAPVPRIGPEELLVKVAACGVCPTDIKKIQFGTVPPPRIFGHETSGTIVRLGARARKFRVGQRVALHRHVPCLDCPACRHRAF